ncbi:hypothetical protein FAP39_00665 [Shimia litoralis]|uniref:Uncharacterized protein n=1 Tax=Shimia litoralis TaxID=420403 RepID=A0A4U7N9K8_9RHOB|nr:hypothetical protein [Shimia litoralis]TKZ22417.1 hypothetical protein FAP39_00665 [Shimia litoralis]
MTNVEASKVFFGVVLARLQNSFPAAVHLKLDDLWPDFEILAAGSGLSVKDGKRSSRQVPIGEVAQNDQLKVHYMKLMLGWMKADGFIHSDPTSDFPYDYVLSSKSLAILGQPFGEGKTTLGAALSQATGRIGEAVQNEIISQIADKVFDAAQGWLG